MGYLVRDDSGSWSSLTALIGHDRLKQWLDLDPDLLANRIADDTIPDEMLQVVKGSLLAWLLGPVAVVAFAALGFLGYWRARRAGLLRSRCKLGDTRIVLVYLAALVAAGVTGIALGWWVW